MNELQRYFQERGIKVEEIVEKIGYSTTYVYDLLRGSRKLRNHPRTQLIKAFPGIEPHLETAEEEPKRFEYLKQSIEYLRTNPTDECVIWPFGHASFGYGIIRLGKKTLKVHRLAYALFHDKPISKFICHHCDLPACYNPAHLYEGTPADNLRDLKQRGPSPHTAAFRQKFGSKVAITRRRRIDRKWGVATVTCTAQDCLSKYTELINNNHLIHIKGGRVFYTSVAATIKRRTVRLARPITANGSTHQTSHYVPCNTQVELIPIEAARAAR